MARLIDLSKPIQYNANDPWYMRVKIKHKSHSQARWLIRFRVAFSALSQVFHGLGR